MSPWNNKRQQIGAESTIWLIYKKKNWLQFPHWVENMHKAYLWGKVILMSCLHVFRARDFDFSPWVKVDLNVIIILVSKLLIC